ncbi:redox-sensing transcriptional repressor Rex [Candidatus Auribacterota bacterium]
MVASKKCITRLSKYKNALYRLKAFGFVKVFSDNVADAVGVTATQVRKDFSLFRISGSRKGGYLIDDLILKLNEILGKNEIQKIVIVGMGNIGTALLNYAGFEKEGIKIIAGFDTNPKRYKEKKGIPVYPLEHLETFVSNNKIKIGIISVPYIAAQTVLDQMISAGIKGVLNFAPIRLRGNDDCTITNVNLVLELENLIYHVKMNALEKNEVKTKTGKN